MTIDKRNYNCNNKEKKKSKIDSNKMLDNVMLQDKIFWHKTKTNKCNKLMKLKI